MRSTSSRTTPIVRSSSFISFRRLRRGRSSRHRTPAERVAILRKSFAALAHDKEFLADAEKSKVEFGFVPGEEIDKVVALIVATPAEVADRYAKAFGPPK
jgi:hypothetical protein